VTVARVVALAAVISAVVLVGFVLFGNSGTYTVSAYFDTAGQLVKGNTVQVGGRVVGSITDITLTNSSEAKVTMTVNDDIAPLHEGTQATIRQGSLSGIANRYVSLQPGPNNAPKISDGGQITADKTTSPVDLDQLFNTLDPKTRKALQQVIQGSATWYAGRSAEASQSTQYLPAALSSTSRLTQEIVSDDDTFSRFVASAATTMNTIAQRRDDLVSLISNANQTAAAIGDENVSLDRALQLLPSTLRKGNTTFVNLRSTLDDLDPLVAESKPATKRLAFFFSRLRPLVHELRPTIGDLNTLIRTPGPNNDLIDLTAKAPHLHSLTSSDFPRAIRAFDKGQPVVEYARMYTPELEGWFKGFAESGAAYDANGHYGRVNPMFAPYAYSGGASPTLTPLAPNATSLDAFRQHQVKRCPGGAIPPTPDGSAPWPVSDCDPSTSPNP
jgi:phospholipid/cholesterol/gamma-HCH transport system substrate-binding protein